MIKRSLSFAGRFVPFVADDRGIAAVEMAFLAPVALGLLSLAVAGGQTLAVDHKVVLAAHTVTDLVSRTPYAQDPNASGAELLARSDLDTDLALSQMIIFPYDSGTLQVVMTELKVDTTTNQGTVTWSEGYNGGTALTCGTKISLDPSFANAGATYLLMGQVSYTFQPLGGILSLPSMTLNASDTLTIRNAQQITVSAIQCP